MQYKMCRNTILDTSRTPTPPQTTKQSQTEVWRGQKPSCPAPVSSSQSSSVQYVTRTIHCVRVHQCSVSLGVLHNRRVSVRAGLNSQCPPSPCWTMGMARVKVADRDKWGSRSVPISQLQSHQLAVSLLPLQLENIPAN